MIPRHVVSPRVTRAVTNPRDCCNSCRKVTHGVASQRAVCGSPGVARAPIRCRLWQMSLQPWKAPMQATLTEKLLRSLLGKSGESIRDQVLIGLEARPRQRSITFSAIGRLRGSGVRQPIRLLVGRYPMMSLAEARDRARLVL